jgi:hypothetical protein
MSEFNFHEIRKGKLILEALLKYGVMNRRTLQTVVPEIKDSRNFRKTLKNLLDRKLIVKRYDTINDYIAVFYQLNQKSFIREALASYLDTQSEVIQQKELRYKELLHEQVLTKISYHLSKRYPNAVILRDHELALNNEAQNIISGLDQVDQMKPDLLFLITTSDQSRKISIAIEFERTAKSKDRMQQKLNFYTQSTRVDGVIYFYSKNRIDHNLNDLFIDRVLEKSLRIKHYGKNFLLTSELHDDVEKSMKLLKNRNGNYYSFQNWLDCLTTSSASNRRDEYFSEVCGPRVIQL